VHVIVGAANLAESIRRFGHLAATLDPLGSAQIGDSTLLPKTHGITDDDLKRLPASLVGGPPAEKLGERLRGDREAAPRLLLHHRIRHRASLRAR
jgi:2-oxoglutarate dehydrogenase E1 component